MISALCDKFIDQSGMLDIDSLLRDEAVGRLVVVSSFGADSAVLLKYIVDIVPNIPVLFIDTGMHFKQTLEYRDLLVKRLNLRLTVVAAEREELGLSDKDNYLHRSDPNKCCQIRKVVPLQRALAAYDGWISGRKRYQSTTRQELPLIEADGGKIKINPLAQWKSADIEDFFKLHNLPRHPMVEGGFPSIGCLPCTSRVDGSSDPRAGRWAHAPEKTECGIHNGPKS